jgi:hypothetical protein
MMTREEAKRQIPEVEALLAQLQEAAREKPDPDPSICYVLVRKEDGHESFDIDTVSRMLSSSLQQGHNQEGDEPQFRDECPVVRAVKVQLTVLEVVQTFSNGLSGG